MKFPALIVAMFMLIVIIIPLTVVSRNGNCLELASAMEGTPLNPVSSVAPMASQTPEVALPVTGEPPAVPTLSPLYDASYFSILDEATGKVNRVSVQDYLRGAVAAEMPPHFHAEALKAQAVAAHTYALLHRTENRTNPPPELKGADFSANPSQWEGYVTEAQAKERFGNNFSLYWGKITDACDSVMEYVLTYEERPILAAYHSTSAGVTEEAANVWMGNVDYLKPVESKGDLLAPGYESQVTISAPSLSQKLKTKYPDMVLPEDPAQWLTVLERSEGGYVLLVDVGDRTLKGKDLRTLLNLRSSHFEVEYTKDVFVFTVSGYGHGVGLSQYGADYMARQGADFTQILLHYYSDVTLCSAPKSKSNALLG